MLCAFLPPVRLVSFKVRHGTDYHNQPGPSKRDMEDIAWIIRTNDVNRRVGFLTVEEKGEGQAQSLVIVPPGVVRDDGPNQLASGGLLLVVTGGVSVHLRGVPQKLWCWLVDQTTMKITVKDDDAAFVWAKRMVPGTEIPQADRASRPRSVGGGGSGFRGMLSSAETMAEFSGVAAGAGAGAGELADGDGGLTRIIPRDLLPRSLGYRRTTKSRQQTTNDQEATNGSTQHAQSRFAYSWGGSGTTYLAGA